MGFVATGYEIGRALGVAIDDQTKVVGVSIDTRTLGGGELFIAIRGERFDGHDFVKTAQQAGARAAIVEVIDDSIDFPQWCVPNCGDALLALANFWRNNLSAQVIGITGSNGKTSVKEMVRTLLGNHRVHATQGNFNNLIGMPLTLLAAPRDSEFVIVEMGMSVPGEMHLLSTTAAPNIVAINNASEAHCEGVGGLAGVRVEKGAIIDGLGSDGCVILNHDDDGYEYWLEYAGDRCVWSFGRNQAADVRLDAGDTQLVVDNTDYPLNVPVPGEHNAMNATCAVAIALAALKAREGINTADLIARIEEFEGVAGRLNFRALSNGAVVIDDTYNANPASVRAAIRTLMSTDATAHYLVLGDMGELGEAADSLHREVVAFAFDHGVDRAWGLGKMSTQAMDSEHARGFEDINALLEDLRECVKPRVHVLVKGSRSMAMERVVDALMEWDSAGALPC